MFLHIRRLELHIIPNAGYVETWKPTKITYVSLAELYTYCIFFGKKKSTSPLAGARLVAGWCTGGARGRASGPMPQLHEASAFDGGPRLKQRAIKRCRSRGLTFLFVWHPP